MKPIPVTSFLREGDLVKVPYLSMRGACKPVSLLYRIDKIDHEWSIRASRMDQRGKGKFALVSLRYLSRGVIVRQNMPVSEPVYADVWTGYGVQARRIS